MGITQRYVVWFKDVDKDDGAVVGGKGANLGEMVKAGLPVPNGFIVTSEAYFYFLKENNFKHIVEKHLGKIDYTDTTSLQDMSTLIKKEFIKGKIPKDLGWEILAYYQKLGHPVFSSFKDELVAVRSSATAEDLKTASFAGQQETFLNVQGEHRLLESIKKVWASLFEARAMFYRETNNIDHFKVGMAVPVQKMVEADVSGVMFTIDPVTNDKSKIVIEAIYGLGEYIVQGKVTPDHYEVDKRSLTLLQKKPYSQDVMLKKVGDGNKEVKVSKVIAGKQKVTDLQIKELAEIGKRLEHHYFFPQDVEWAIEKGKIYIVQTRPVTTTKVQSSKLKVKNEYKSFEISNEPILRGDPASPGIATGHVQIVHNPSELHLVKQGDVLVASVTNPDYVISMKKAVAIITERGGRTSHAAIVSRELGIPAVVGVEAATKLLHNGITVTVNGATGEVFKGGFESSKFKIQSSKSEETRGRVTTKTKLYVNLSEPERVQEVARMDVDGVGLLRAEFMMADIGTHPQKFIDDGREKIFIDQLSGKLKIFCQAFHPRPVVYRSSDFKTNEYRNLRGGDKYEPKEENPMLGMRGAYRYIKQPEIFKMEIASIKRVREKEGLQNLWLMVPFARTPQELKTVKKILSSNGLIRSKTFKLWLMVETPANVLKLADFIATGVDGISIGSNDLTMLTLGVDRDNSLVSEIFNESDSAVLSLIEQAVKEASKHHILSSICGQLPSVNPVIVEKLVSWDITSISVSPDMVDQTRLVISKAEESERSLQRGKN